MRNKMDQASVQFDYFSSNYQQFETDFYRVARTLVPLAFLADDILRSMVARGQPYFKLQASQAQDQKDHYFIFRPKSCPDNQEVIRYEYLGHRTQP